jgi:hypothetical protein
VFAGAACTYSLEANQRRVESLAAARLIFAALASADAVLSDAETTQSWGSAGKGAIGVFQEQIAVWEAQRDRVARVADVVDFQSMAGAFNNIAHINDAIESATQRGLPDRGVSQVLQDPHTNYAWR